MDWHQTVFELIDLRSFSNLWFWIALAVMWSSASHWVLGVPFDLILRARRKGGVAMDDLESLTRVNINRILYIVDTAGSWLILITFFVLTLLAMSGFYYGMEFAQAVFLLGFPMSIVGAMSLRTARLIIADGVEGAAIIRRLIRHRFWVQFLGMISIFVTALWGMYQNFLASPIG